MNRSWILTLELLGGLLSRPKKEHFELRGEVLFADGSPVRTVGLESGDVGSRIKMLARQVGCSDVEPEQIVEAWSRAMKENPSRSRGELLDLARRERSSIGGAAVERWASSFRRRLAPALAAMPHVEAFGAAASEDLRKSHLELMPLLEVWPRRLLTAPTWAFVESPIPQMAPLPIDQVWVDLGLVDFALSNGLPSERSLVERLESRYEAHRWQAESVDLMLDRLNRSAALIGPPGSGKTTLIKWLARHLILHPEDRFILPLVVPLREYCLRAEANTAGSGLLAFAIELCGVRSPRQRELWIHALGQLAGPEGENVFILLDGWDEVPATQREVLRREIETLSNGFSVVITSRPSAYPRSLPTADFYQISELAPENVAVLLRRWFGSATGRREADAAGRLLEHLDRHTDLRRMARNPFLLTLLCGIHQASLGSSSGSSLPITRSELYTQSLKLIYTHHDQRRPDAHFDAKRRKQVEQLAFWLLAEAPAAPRYAFGRQDVAAAVGDDELFERYLQPSRLLDAWDAEAETHHFLHLTFQEYLAARALATRSAPNADGLAMAHLNDPAWQNVLLFLAADTGPVGRAFWGRAADLARHPDHFGLIPVRLARWVAEQGASDGGEELLGLDLRNELWRHIESLPLDDLALLFPYVDAYAAMDRPGLLRRLRAASSEQSPQGSRFARALMQIQGSASSDDLVDLILDGGSAGNPMFATDLRRHLNEEGFQRLRQKARDAGADQDLRARAILALGYAADFSSIPWLLEIARDEATRVDSTFGLVNPIVRAFAFMGSDEAAMALAEILHWYEKLEWQTPVITALGQIRSRTSRDLLLAELALRPPSDPICVPVLESLWDKPIFHGRDVLLDVLAAETDDNTRSNAALILGQVPGFGIVQALADLARQDKSPKVQLVALQALERRARLSDLSWLRRRFSALSGGTNVNELRAILRALLFATAKFADSEGGEDLQEDAVRLVHQSFRLDPSLAVDVAKHAHLAGVKVAGVLLEACQDPLLDSRTRAEACHALGRIHYRPAVPALIDLLQNPSSDLVSRAAARALAEIDFAALQAQPGETARKALANHAVEHGFLVFDQEIIGPDGRRWPLSTPKVEPSPADARGENRPSATSVTKGPDLEIRVSLDSSTASGKLIFTLHSYHLHLFNYEITGSSLKRKPEEYFAEVFATLENLHRKLAQGSEPLSDEQTEQALAKVGRQLYDELFPPELKTIYRRLRKKNLETLLLVSDEPWIPWEIVKPYDDKDPDDEIINDDFLGSKFQLTRWLSGTSSPAEVIQIRKMATLIVGTQAPLEKAVSEADLFEELAGRHPGVQALRLEDPGHSQILDLLALGKLDLVHFIGHGKYDSNSPDRSWLPLRDVGRLEPADFQGEVQSGLRKTRPLVFLNACQMGRAGQSLTRLGGWAPRLVDCQVGAFIAPLWNVGDEQAHAFCTTFYRALEAGATLGRATCEARKSIRKEGQIAHLAYAVYAHPNGRVVFGSPAESAETATAPAAEGSGTSLELIRNFSLLAGNEANWIAGENENDPRITGDIYLASLYVHRKQELQVVRAVLSTEKLAPIVLVKGVAGHGKTSLLWGVASALRQRTEREVLFLKADWLRLDVSKREATSALLGVEDLLAAVAQLREMGHPPILLVDTMDVLLHDSQDRRRALDLLVNLHRLGAALVLTCRLQEARLLQSALPITPIHLGTYEDSHDPEDGAGGESEMARAVRSHASRFYQRFHQLDIQQHVAEILEATSRRRAFHDVCVNPLTLRMLFILYAPEEIHGQEINVYQLYRDFWSRRIRSDQRAGSPLAEKPAADLTVTAAAVALIMVAEGTPSLERAFIERNSVLLGGKCAEVESLLGRGALLESNSMVRFFHQSFLEHAAAQGFLSLDGTRGLDLLSSRVFDNPDNFFLSPVLEQALLLATEYPAQRTRRDEILCRLLDSAQPDDKKTGASLLLSGLYVYAHSPTLADSSIEAMERHLRHGSSDLVEDFLDLVPNVNFKDPRRRDRLFVELDLIWNRFLWPEQKKILELLRRFLPWHFETVRMLLDRWEVAEWAASQPGSNAAEMALLDLLDLAANLDGQWVFALVTRLYRELDSRRMNTKGLERILAFLAANPERFGAAMLAQAFETATGSTDSERLHATVTEAWGKLWAAQWRSQGIALEALLESIEPFRGFSLEIRLNGLTELLLEQGGEATRSVLGYVGRLKDSDSQTSWSRTILSRLLRGSAGVAERDSPAVATTRRALLARLSSADSTARPSVADRAWIKALQLAKPPLVPWEKESLQILKDLPPEAWLDPARCLYLVVPAAGAGIAGALEVLRQVSENPEAFEGPLRFLLPELELACKSGEALDGYLKRLAIRSAKARPILGLANQGGLQLSTDFGVRELDALISNGSRSAERSVRRDAFLLWAQAIRQELLDCPPLADIAEFLHSERETDVATAILQVLEETWQMAKFSFEELREVLSGNRFNRPTAPLGELGLRFQLRAMADEKVSSVQLLEAAFDLATAEPTNPERLGLFARVLMAQRQTQGNTVADLIERMIDCPAVSRLSAATQFSIHSRFLVVARDAFSCLDAAKQRALIARVPGWPENLGGLIVAAATMAGAASVWADLEALRSQPSLSPRLHRIITERHRFEDELKGTKGWPELYRVFTAS